MVRTIIAVIGLTSSIKNAIKLVGDSLHKSNAMKHENFRRKDVTHLEEATSVYYFDGINDPDVHEPR